MYVVCTFATDPAKREFFTGTFTGAVGSKSGFAPSMTAEVRRAVVFDNPFQAVEIVEAFRMLTHAMPGSVSRPWSAMPLAHVGARS
ncbi:MAG: hypothetical protein AB7U62_17945 [Pseudolabrys sp.]